VPQSHDAREENLSGCDPATLLQAVAAGDQAAMARLYDTTSALVYGLALRILSDASEAQDVTLEVYLQVWRQAAQYDPQRGTFMAWLSAIIHPLL
jgi:RNA polymerase sigma-70 factor, ECF subfamily